MTDPIADMLARIRNAITARRAKVQMPLSKLKLHIAEVLRDEGFIGGVQHENTPPQGTLTLELSYDHNNRNAISGLRRVSRPGQRAYARQQKLPKIRSGLGIAILTTSHGIMTAE